MGSRFLTGERALIIAVGALVIFGILMVYSASSVIASGRFGDSFYFAKRQAAWIVLGTVAAAVLSRTDYRIWLRGILPIILATLALLVVVLIPGIGSAVNGSRRWLKAGPFSFQPSEAAKVATVLYLARYLSKKSDRIEDFVHGLLPCLLVPGVVVVLILVEPDFGTAATLALVVGLLLFVGGASLRQLGLLSALAVPFLIFFVMAAPYRRERFLVFLNPWRDPSDSGFQIIQSFVALGAGGLRGVGLGEGKQKLFFLPEPHTDFIFSVIGEELGLIGTGFLLILFGFVLMRGASIALWAHDANGRILAAGLTLLLAVSAFLNMGVTTGLLPTKGLSLPFISYGGSGLLMNFSAIGLLLSVLRFGGGAASGRAVGDRRAIGCAVGDRRAIG